jgi:anti-anti-sigma factor
MDDMSPSEGRLCTVELSAEEPGTVVVRIIGELDLSSIPEVASRVEPALASNPRALVVDLSGLRFADSSAIALWVRWATTIDRFELRNTPSFVRRVIAAMGLSERLGVDD